MTEILLDKPSRARHDHPVGRARGCCPVCAPDAYAMLWARHRANVPLDLTDQSRPWFTTPRAVLRLSGVFVLLAILGLTTPAAHGEDPDGDPYVPAWGTTDIPPLDLLPEQTRKVRVCKPGRTVVRIYTRTAGLGEWHLTDRRVHRHPERACFR